MEKLHFPKSLGHDPYPSICTVQISQASPLFFFFLKGPDFVVISKSGLVQEFSRLSEGHWLLVHPFLVQPLFDHFKRNVFVVKLPNTD